MAERVNQVIGRIRGHQHGRQDAIEGLPDHGESFETRKPRHVHVEQYEMDEIHLHEFDRFAAVLGASSVRNP